MSLNDEPRKYYSNVNGPEIERYGSYFAPAVEDAWGEQRWNHFIEVACGAVGANAGYAFTAEVCILLEDASQHPILRANLLMAEMKEEA